MVDWTVGLIALAILFALSRGVSGAVGFWLHDSVGYDIEGASGLGGVAAALFVIVGMIGGSRLYLWAFPRKEKG